MRSAEYLLNLLPFFRFLEDSAEHASNVLDSPASAKCFRFRRIPSGELAVFVDPQPKNIIVSVEAGECDAR